MGCNSQGLAWDCLNFFIYHIPLLCDIEKSPNHYPHSTNKSPCISNRDTTKNFGVTPSQASSGPGGLYRRRLFGTCLLVTKSSLPSGGVRKNWGFHNIPRNLNGTAIDFFIYFTGSSVRKHTSKCIFFFFRRPRGAGIIIIRLTGRQKIQSGLFGL